MRCDCHEVEIYPTEPVWIKDDGTILCEDGRLDELHEDIFDQHDHGSIYRPKGILHEGSH